MNNSNTLQCSICLDPVFISPVKSFLTGKSKTLFQGKIVTLACNHKFHAKCITPWLKRELTCPNDRQYASSANITLPLPNNLSDRLVSAVKDNNQDEVKVILARGVSPDAGRGVSDAPLYHAVNRKNIAMAELLISYGAKDALSLTTLAKLYENTQDNTKALLCYRSAAEQDYAPAQFSLAKMFEMGTEGEPDYIQAADLYQKAANQGHVRAITCLARFYRKGLGVEKNLTKAILLYQQAARQGNSIAQRRLASMYHLGPVVPQDMQKALAWYKKAAEQGDSIAQFNLAWMYEQVEETKDIEKSKYWYQQAADQGYANAQQKLLSLMQVYN